MTGTRLTCSDTPPDDVPQVPTAPYDITETDDTQTSVSLSWSIDDRGAPITRSQIHRWDSGAICSGPAREQYTVTGAATAETITGLTNQTYYFKIRARNRVGWSHFSACTAIEVGSIGVVFPPPDCGSFEGSICSAGSLYGSIARTDRGCNDDETGEHIDYEWVCESGDNLITCNQTVDTCESNTCQDPPVCGTGGSCQGGGSEGRRGYEALECSGEDTGMGSWGQQCPLIRGPSPPAAARRPHRRRSSCRRRMGRGTAAGRRRMYRAHELSGRSRRLRLHFSPYDSIEEFRG